MAVTEGIVGVGGEVDDGTGLGSVIGKDVIIGVVAAVGVVAVGDADGMGVIGSVDNIVGDINVGVVVGAIVIVT